jgi:hypothetical protein
MKDYSAMRYKLRGGKTHVQAKKEREKRQNLIRNTEPINMQICFKEELEYQFTQSESKTEAFQTKTWKKKSTIS